MTYSSLNARLADLELVAFGFAGSKDRLAAAQARIRERAKQAERKRQSEREKIAYATYGLAPEEADRVEAEMEAVFDAVQE